MKKCFFLFFIIIGCEKIDRIISIDKLIVYKTSRDSTYFLKEKPFSGEVYQNDNEGNKIRSFNVIDGKLSGIYEEFFSDGKTKLFMEMESGNKNGEFKSLNTKMNQELSYLVLVIPAVIFVAMHELRTVLDVVSSVIWSFGQFLYWFYYF